jgi:hypothetical protein
METPRLALTPVRARVQSATPPVAATVTLAHTKMHAQHIIESLGPVHHGLYLEDWDSHFICELQHSMQNGVYTVSPDNLVYRTAM